MTKPKNENARCRPSRSKSAGPKDDAPETVEPYIPSWKASLHITPTSRADSQLIYELLQELLGNVDGFEIKVVAGSVLQDLPEIYIENYDGVYTLMTTDKEGVLYERTPLEKTVAKCLIELKKYPVVER